MEKLLELLTDENLTLMFQMIVALVGGGVVTVGGLKFNFPGARGMKLRLISEKEAVIKLGSMKSDHVLTVIYQKSQDDMEAPAKLVDASRLAVEFFGVVGKEQIIGKTAEQLMEIIAPYLSNRTEFVEDQIEVQSRLQHGQKAFAKVPMVMSDEHPIDRFHGKSYHPIIVLSSTEKGKRGIKNEYLTVLYLDLSHLPFVTDAPTPKAA